MSLNKRRKRAIEKMKQKMPARWRFFEYEGGAYVGKVTRTKIEKSTGNLALSGLSASFTGESLDGKRIVDLINSKVDDTTIVKNKPIKLSGLTIVEW